jgi:hypothetical protein
MARVKPRPPTVTRLDGSSQAKFKIEAPRGCTATVLLKMVQRDTVKRETYWALWLLVGRAGDVAASVDVGAANEDILRFDVPDDTLVTPEYLQRYLEEFFASDPGTRGDTPIIKG